MQEAQWHGIVSVYGMPVSAKSEKEGRMLCHEFSDNFIEYARIQGGKKKEMRTFFELD